MITSPKPVHRSELTLLAWMILPPTLLAALFVYGVVRERRAAARIDAAIASVAQQHLPSGNTTVNQLFDERLSKEHSRQWRDVLTATNELHAKFIWTDMFDERWWKGVKHDEPLPNESRLTAYLAAAKPIIDKIESLSGDSRPTWQPLIYQGYRTSLPELLQAKELVRMLTVEFRYAVRHQHHDRALEALKSIRTVSDAFDWQIGLVSDMNTLQHHKVHRDLIRDSLAAGFWQEEQHLQRLVTELGEAEDYDQRWRLAVTHEQASVLAELQSQKSGAQVESVFPFGVSAAALVNLTEDSIRATRVQGVGTWAYVRMAHQQDLQSAAHDQHGSGPGYTINGIPLANSQFVSAAFSMNHAQVAKVYADDAMERRWTITAIAIKKFQLQKQRWPAELAELAQVDLPAKQWKAWHHEPFGYHVDKARNEAILWTAYANSSAAGGPLVPLQPPGQIGPDSTGVMSAETRLR
ncbi:MAG: hypothetical protein MI861_08135 [Pirellulales bacterium]|nr:hypothetical protein [Pirellulales bacterium]